MKAANRIPSHVIFLSLLVALVVLVAAAFPGIAEAAAPASGRVAASAVLLAMGVAPEIAETAIRISWGWATTRAELEAFATAWQAMAGRLQARAA